MIIGDELENLESERINLVRELQELMSDFSASKLELDQKSMSKEEKIAEQNWRLDALDRKTDIENKLRNVKKLIKEKNLEKHGNDGTFASHAKDISRKLDIIISLMEKNR